MKSFFGLTHFPFKKEIDKIFISQQLGYLAKRSAHFLETSGIALLTGDIGSGKTTFIRYFLNTLYGKSGNSPYKLVYLSQTARTARSFFRMLAVALGLIPKFFIEDVSMQVKSELNDIFSKRKQFPVIVIDEAQNLSDTVLEEIRLLTNFNMDSKDCASVFLLGHPVLKAKLKLSPYSALKQRISFAYHLTGLEQNEIDPYIMHRLKLAGKTKSPFTDEAVILIFNYSKGLPRIINTIAHEALYIAASAEKDMIDEKLIENIIQQWDTL